MQDISSLKCADRVEIFKHLAKKKNDSLNLDIVDSIAGPSYHNFLEFCDKVFEERENIEDISCRVKDGTCKFKIQYKKD